MQHRPTTRPRMVRMEHHPAQDDRRGLSLYARKSLITISLAAAAIILLWALWYSTGMLLIAFAGLLMAIFLSRLANLISDYTHLPRLACLIGVILTLTALVAALFVLLMPRLGPEIDRLSEELPQAANQALKQLQDYSWGRELSQFLEKQVGSLVHSEKIWTKTTGMLSSTTSVLLYIVIVIFLGLYLSLTPQRYMNGLLYLLPPTRRDRFRTVMDTVSHTLFRWLVGKLASMAVVGLLTWVGLWWLDIPLAGTLALIAATFSFVPNFGPVLAAIPAVLLGLAEGWGTAGYVLLLYIGAQMLESYLITPLIQMKAVHMPPALIIMAQVIMSVMSGALGLILATPLLAMTIVMVQMLIVEDVYGDKVTTLDGQEYEDRNHNATEPTPAESS